MRRKIALGHMATLNQSSMEEYVQETMESWVASVRGQSQINLRDEMLKIFQVIFGKYLFAIDVTKRQIEIIVQNEKNEYVPMKMHVFNAVLQVNKQFPNIVLLNLYCGKRNLISKAQRVAYRNWQAIMREMDEIVGNHDETRDHD